MPLGYPSTTDLVERVRAAAAGLRRELAPAHVFCAPPEYALEESEADLNAR